jgi:hypothetical protein
MGREVEKRYGCRDVEPLIHARYRTRALQWTMGISCNSRDEELLYVNADGADHVDGTETIHV